MWSDGHRLPTGITANDHENTQRWWLVRALQRTKWITMCQQVPVRCCVMQCSGRMVGILLFTGR